MNTPSRCSHPISNRRRFVRTLVVGAFASAAAARSLLEPALQAGEGPLGVGAPFPGLDRFQLEGALPEVKGKVVLVDFFASWCGPCKASVPALQALHTEYKARGLVVLGVNVDEKKANMDAFLKKHPVDFPIVRDAAQKLVAEVKVASMPSSFLVDASGVVRFVHTGFRGEETRRQYIREIESLLKPGSK